MAETDTETRQTALEHASYAAAGRLEPGLRPLHRNVRTRQYQMADIGDSTIPALSGIATDELVFGSGRQGRGDRTAERPIPAIRRKIDDQNAPLGHEPPSRTVTI